MMGLDIAETRFESLTEFNNTVDVSTIRAELLEEIAYYYALKHQFKVVSLNNSCYFCLNCKEKEYNFQLSLVSRLSLSENLRMEILTQNQEVMFCSDIDYLNQKLSYFREKNIQKQNEITEYTANSYSIQHTCSGCGH